MTMFQYVMLFLAILATLYQITKVLQLLLLYKRFVRFTIQTSWYVGVIISVAIQIACLYAFLGVKS